MKKLLFLISLKQLKQKLPSWCMSRSLQFLMIFLGSDRVVFVEIQAKDEQVKEWRGWYFLLLAAPCHRNEIWHNFGWKEECLTNRNIEHLLLFFQIHYIFGRSIIEILPDVVFRLTLALWMVQHLAASFFLEVMKNHLPHGCHWLELQVGNWWRSDNGERQNWRSANRQGLGLGHCCR